MILGGRTLWTAWHELLPVLRYILVGHELSMGPSHGMPPIVWILWTAWPDEGHIGSSGISVSTNTSNPIETLNVQYLNNKPLLNLSNELVVDTALPTSINY